jgi:hypothetical protein
MNADVAPSASPALERTKSSLFGRLDAAEGLPPRPFKVCPRGSLGLIGVQHHEVLSYTPDRESCERFALPVGVVRAASQERAAKNPGCRSSVRSHLQVRPREDLRAAISHFGCGFAAR